MGITYSPYTKSDGCKSASQIAQDIAKLSNMKSLDYTVLIVPELKMCYQPWVLIKIVLGVWNIDSPQGNYKILLVLSSRVLAVGTLFTLLLGMKELMLVLPVAQVQQAVDISKKYLEISRIQWSNCHC